MASHGGNPFNNNHPDILIMSYYCSDLDVDVEFFDKKHFFERATSYLSVFNVLDRYISQEKHLQFRAFKITDISKDVGEKSDENTLVIRSHEFRFDGTNNYEDAADPDAGYKLKCCKDIATMVIICHRHRTKNILLSYTDGAATENQEPLYLNGGNGGKINVLLLNKDENADIPNFFSVLRETPLVYKMFPTPHPIVCSNCLVSTMVKTVNRENAEEIVYAWILKSFQEPRGCKSEIKYINEREDSETANSAEAEEEAFFKIVSTKTLDENQSNFVSNEDNIANSQLTPNDATVESHKTDAEKTTSSIGANNNFEKKFKTRSYLYYEFRKKPKFRRTRGNYKYETLGDVYGELQSTIMEEDAEGATPSAILPTLKFIYAVVDELKPNTKKGTYIIKMSDETKADVIGRICKVANSDIGPKPTPGCIIRIHRATVQFEFHEGQQEMVVSTPQHSNFTLFYEKHGKIDFLTSAKTISMSDKDEDRIRRLLDWKTRKSNEVVTK